MSLPDVVSPEAWRKARIDLLADEKAMTKAHDALVDQAARAADGRGHEGLPVRRSGRHGRSARPVRRAQPAHRLSLHVQPGVGRRVPELHRRRRRDVARPDRAPARARHDARVRVARADREDREVQGQAGLDVPLVLVVRLGLQLRLRRHARRVGAAGRVQLPDEGRVRGDAANPCTPRATVRSSTRAAASSCASATRSSTRTRCTRAGLETMGGSYYLLDETALGRQEDWEEPKGRADTGTRRDARLPRLSRATR